MKKYARSEDYYNIKLLPPIKSLIRQIDVLTQDVDYQAVLKKRISKYSRKNNITVCYQSIYNSTRNDMFTNMISNILLNRYKGYIIHHYEYKQKIMNIKWISTSSK